MARNFLQKKLERFQRAVSLFIERVEQDANILAVVLVGSLNEETIWRKETIGLWIIEKDGVSKRLHADGKDERIFRIFSEDGINIHAEVIPRSRFKLMVEGSSRTAFSCNFFAHRALIYSVDGSIPSWFEQANTLATKDQEKELLAAATWLIHAERHARKELEIKKDVPMARQTVLWGAHSMAALEVIKQGLIYEQEPIYKALELEPDLFKTVYLDVLSSTRKKAVQVALEEMTGYIQRHGDSLLKPLIHFLRKQKRVVALSEISESFAHTQLYPWHLESACEWLERTGQLEKVSAPFKITTRSRVDVEEPAYFYDS